MENSFQKLNEIMKPYFDIKQEIENDELNLKKDKEESQQKIKDYDTQIINRKKLLKKARIARKKELQDELADLIMTTNKKVTDLEKKKEEIVNDKISNTINSDSNLFIGYGTILRKDIEKSLEKDYDSLIAKIKESYKIEEKILLNQIKVLSSKNDKYDLELAELIDNKDKEEVYLNNLNIEVPKDNSKLEEFARTKLSVNRSLALYKYELEVELYRDKDIFEKLNNGLNNFKFEYDSEGKIVNGESRIGILKNINSIKEQIERLEATLKSIDEYLKLTKTTEEENVKIMLSSDKPVKEKDYSYEEFELNGDLENNTNDDFNVDVERINNEVHVDSKRELIKFIYSDVINEINGIDSINLKEDDIFEDTYYVHTKSKLDNEEMTYSDKLDMGYNDIPSGEYVNLNNLSKALDEYYSKNKDVVYVTGDDFNKYRITTRSINKLKDKIRNCSSIKLMGFQTILNTKVSEVYVKEKDNDEYNEENSGKIVGRINIEPGEYINRNELLVKMNKLFRKKFQLFDNIDDMFKTDDESMTYKKIK